MHVRLYCVFPRLSLYAGLIFRYDAFDALLVSDLFRIKRYESKIQNAPPISYNMSQMTLMSQIMSHYNENSSRRHALF
jgi:hypothetical protein